MGDFKSKTGDKTMIKRQKHKDNKKVRNFAAYITNSNSDFCAPVEWNDRRAWIFQMSTKTICAGRCLCRVDRLSG